jgi:hypothetical protein
MEIVIQVRHKPYFAAVNLVSPIPSPSKQEPRCFPQSSKGQDRSVGGSRIERPRRRSGNDDLKILLIANEFRHRHHPHLRRRCLRFLSSFHFSSSRSERIFLISSMRLTSFGLARTGSFCCCIRRESLSFSFDENHLLRQLVISTIWTPLKRCNKSEIIRR